MSNLVKCYELIFKKAIEARSNNPDADGLSFWRSIKDKLAIYDNLIASEWKVLPKILTTQILELPEYYILGNSTKITIQTNHFLIQQFRIPLVENPSFRKIMQIALNAGQYYPVRDTLEISLELQAQYNQGEYWKLHNYISDDNIAKFQEIPASFIEDLESTLTDWLDKH